MVLRRLTTQDRADLRNAVELVAGVLNRHPMEMQFPILTRFQQMVRDVNAIEGMFDSEEEAA